MGRLTKIVVGIAAFFLLYTIFGFFAAPALLKSVLTERLAKQFHREVSIRDIKINPYSLTLRMSGFSMNRREKPGVFFSFDELYVNLQSVSLIKRAVVLSEFQLTAPFVNLPAGCENSFNFSDLMEQKGAPENGTGMARKPLRFSVNNIGITGGRIDSLDEPNKTTTGSRISPSAFRSYPISLTKPEST